MHSRTRPAANWTLTFILVSLAACTPSKKQDDNDTLPAKPQNEGPIDANHALQALTMSVDFKDDGMLLHIGNVPAGGALECNLDNKPLTPCHDGALLQKPAAGDHRIAGQARVSGNLVAQGQTDVFNVSPSNGAVDTEPTPAGGSLVLDADQSFGTGQTASLDQDFVVKFHLDAKAPCAAPVMKCKYDSRTSPFWTACDAGNSSFTVPKGLMAEGLQYLSVQASCGDTVGPALTLSWWGVPSGYQPLMLRDLADSNGRHVLNLAKADDCPTDKQSFQCAPTAQDDFSLCSEGNTVDQPQAGYRVRLACNGQTGPVLTLGL